MRRFFIGENPETARHNRGYPGHYDRRCRRLHLGRELRQLDGDPVRISLVVLSTL
jgi:hypothetical protein